MIRSWSKPISGSSATRVSPARPAVVVPALPLFALLLSALLLSALLLSACACPAQRATTARTLTSGATAPPAAALEEPRATAAPGATSDQPAPPNRIVIAHGTGSDPAGWPTALADAIRAAFGPLDHWTVDVLDWRAASEHPLTAARRGYRLGEEYAAALVGSAPRVVHLIAHSMGAHLIQGIADGIRRHEAAHPDVSETAIHMTFLDAFHPRGVLTARWGIRTFGRGADFAESYVTRDEPAFLTNALLNRAFSFDLSRTVPPRENPSSGYAHNWPPAWYVATVSDAPSPGFSLSPLALLGDRIHPRGAAVATMRSLAKSFPAGGAEPLYE